MKKYGELFENVDLKKYNTYKIGGKTKYLIKPYNIENLKDLIKYLNENNIKYKVIGRGSNIILPDEDYDGVIIILDNINKFEINNNNVSVEAGITLSLFINELINNDLGGLENLYGIPGTLGAGIFGNVGCYGNEISDYIVNITYLEDGKIKTKTKEECKFNYRDSIFKQDKNKIIIGAEFKLYKDDKTKMRLKIKENMFKRKNNQPLEYPNAGSVFKNPIGFSAGKLIEDCNLKNRNVNDAYVSGKHANFIINKGNAKSEDIKQLINIIKKEVKEKHNIELILEQEIVKY